MTARKHSHRGAFDINQPGRVQPQPTSRPVIVGHHPAMPDPMLAQRPLHHQPRPPAGGPPPTPPATPPPGLIDGILRPPEAYQSADEAPKGPPAIIEGEPFQSPPFASAAPENKPPSSHFPTGPTLSSVTPAPIEHAPPATVVGEDNKPLEMPAAKHETHFWRWTLVIIILVLVGLYLLIDAEIIDIGFSPPFEIFK